MCGLIGLVGSTDVERAGESVRAATYKLRHRGPDAHGFFVEGPVALGHSRLSIIDTSPAANQPMFSPSGKTVIVFNGEIYNFQKIRSELEREGERFRTGSDTEVLLRLIEREDTDAFHKLQGMFAIACWRRDRGELLLARDRFGEKPLYAASLGTGIAFGSEIPALVTLEEIPRRLDFEALGYFLECGIVPAPLTMFAGVSMLEPGHWLKWRNGMVERGTYFQIDYRPDKELGALEIAAAAVRKSLQAAIRRQMISDVPLGAFLSGGIDSSSIVALMQEASSRPVKTFSVRFEHAPYDESPVARRVAQHLGTDHHELIVTDGSFHDDDLWRIIDHVGVPFYDSSAIPTYIVSRHARQQVTVALSGDGGDEMFAGYPVFWWGDIVNRLASLPAVVNRVAASSSSVFAQCPGFNRVSILRQARKAFGAARESNDADRFRALHRLFTPTDIDELLTLPAAEQIGVGSRNRLTVLPPEAANWTPLRRMMFSRLKCQMSCDMLIKIDTMSMATSLEVRCPFLDPQLAALSMRLPDEHLIRGRIGKFVLREAMRPYLPKAVFSHPKWGFSIPLHTFFNERFRKTARELLNANGVIAALLKKQTVHKILACGLTRRQDASDLSVYQATHQLWSLVQLAAWLHRYNVSLN
jgi:asparagine synthase (glutamine-hydrolysing)